MSRISETTNSGVVRIADDQFAILVNLLNKIAGNPPEAAHAAIASVAARQTRPVLKPPFVPQHAPTITTPPKTPTPTPLPSATKAASVVEEKKIAQAEIDKAAADKLAIERAAANKAAAERAEAAKKAVSPSMGPKGNTGNTGASGLSPAFGGPPTQPLYPTAKERAHAAAIDDEPDKGWIDDPSSKSY